jgi:hypothetical protein
MLAISHSRKRRPSSKSSPFRLPRNLTSAAAYASSQFGARARSAVAVVVLLWLFCDLDSYPLWILWWGTGGPPPPDPRLTHGCVEPDYSRPLAVVVPLIASQLPRLLESMKLWGTPDGLPCTSSPAVLDRPHLLFYFDRPLVEPEVSSAVQDIHRFTSDDMAVRIALQTCFANVSFTSAGLSATATRNSRSFDVLRNLASTRGSNNQFWNAFVVHAAYRHMFYMEPDTWPLKPNWLHRIDLLSRDQAFWMRGSLMRYQPRLVVAPEPFRSAYMRHINGNAVYELHDPCFARYRDLVRAVYGDAAFDVAMAQYRMPRHQYRLEHAIAHRFAATDVIADMGVEQFATAVELRSKLPGTYLAHAKFNYVSAISYSVVQY